ncbi:MAG: hypothetical protein ACRDHM_05745 [Actinomycetota bacterium]
MANWMKQVTKSASHVLEPGESFLAAQQFNSSSVMGDSQGTAGAIGGILGEAAAMVVDKRRAKREEERQRDVAEESGVQEADVAWPGESSLVALTDRRLLFFGMRGLAKAGDLFLEIPREDLVHVDRIDVEGDLKAGRVKTLQARFVRRDNTAVSVHGPNLGVNARRLKAFLDAVDEAARAAG